MKSSERACRAIRAASTESQVLQAVSDYLESLDPRAIAFLPAELMSIGLRHAEEVIHSALQLVHDHMLGSEGSPEAAALSDIALVLSTAARRLVTLAKNTA